MTTSARPFTSAAQNDQKSCLLIEYSHSLSREGTSLSRSLFTEYTPKNCDILTYILLCIIIIPLGYIGWFPLSGNITRVVLLLPVWNHLPGLQKSLWWMHNGHQFLDSFTPFWFTTPAIQRFPQHRHFLFCCRLQRTLESQFQCSRNYRCLYDFPKWLHNLIKAHGTTWLFPFRSYS